MLNRSHRLSLSLLLCRLYHICLNYCPFVLWFSTSFPLLFVSSVFISHVPVWPGWGHPYPQCMYDSTSLRAVCLCALACRMERGTTVHSNRLLKRLCGQWCTLPDGRLHTLYIILLLRRLESLMFFHTIMGNVLAMPLLQLLTIGSMTTSDLIKQVFISAFSSFCWKVISNISWLECFSSAGQSGYFLLPMPIFSLVCF